MKICTSPAEFRALCHDHGWGRSHTLGFVPTMGALHEGHLSLIDRARAHGGPDAVIVSSIFINPTQFDNASDLESYPKTLERDLDLLAQRGVGAVFLPTQEDVYPKGSETLVELPRLSNRLHGQTRPGHFRGVTSVVARLFNIVRPNFAVFGEKDYQQLAIIRHMSRDLFFDIEILSGPTIREADGLAMSSRNMRLRPEDRAAAPILYRAMQRAERYFAANPATPRALHDIIAHEISQEPRALIERIDLVDPDTLDELEDAHPSRIALLLSVRFGEILLIDQMVLEKEPTS